MTVIDANTVTVRTSSELKTVLEGNNTYTYIYFEEDITLTSGITISPTKTVVTIDGTYQGIRHAYTDMKSAGSGDTISVRNASNKQVTLKNMNVTGYNYYGLIYVPEDNSLSNIIIEYNNLTYTGPQITFHPTGLSRYIDCDITIVTNYLTANEVAECNRIEIGGTTTIQHNSTGDTMFWFRGSNPPYLKILSSSNVTMTSESRELFYGVTNLDFQVLEGASLTLRSANGMGYNGYATGNTLIDKNATLLITQTKQNGSYPTWYCNGPLVMNENSTLSMTSNYTGNTSNYSLYFRTTSASFTLNNPKKVVIYNRNANITYSDSQIPFQFTYTRINLWTKTAAFDLAGSIDDIPTYAWYKNNELSTLTGTITSSTTNLTSNNYTAQELTSLPPLTNFQLQGKKVLSIGKLLLNVDALTDQDLIIKGYTEPLADVKLSYETTTTQVSANNTGIFESNIDHTLAVGTKVNFLANVKNSFLYQSKEITIVYSGELTLDGATKTITFTLLPFSLNPPLCPRGEDLTITVTDTRIHSSDWKLYASINHELISQNGYQLTDSLIFVNMDQVVTALSITPTLVYQGSNNGGSTKITTINWTTKEGILLRVANEPLQNGEKYRTTITWTIEE